MFNSYREFIDYMTYKYTTQSILTYTSKYPFSTVTRYRIEKLEIRYSEYGGPHMNVKCSLRDIVTNYQYVLTFHYSLCVSDELEKKIYGSYPYNIPEEVEMEVDTKDSI